jgi:hypothetical protein
VWDTFSAIKLVDALLDGGQKFDSLSYLVQRNFIGQLADRFQDKSFLRHAPNMRLRSGRSKFEEKKVQIKKPSWLVLFSGGARGSGAGDYVLAIANLKLLFTLAFNEDNEDVPNQLPPWFARAFL